jgi:hypothetical protein
MKPQAQPWLLIAASLIVGGLAGWLLFSSARAPVASISASGAPSGSSPSIAAAMPARVGAAGVSDTASANYATASQLDELTAAVAALRDEIDALRAERPSTGQSADAKLDATPFLPLPPQLDTASMLHATLEQESLDAQQSRWGRQAEASISAAFEAKRWDNPFFLRYGGEVETQCHQTVCELRWSPTQDIGVSEDDRLAMTEAARWELIALMGQSGASGEFAVSADANDPAGQVQVLFQAEAGGDWPDAIVHK